MKNNLIYILLLSMFISATALGCVEQNYCKRQDSLIFTSHPYVYMVDFKDKLAKKEIVLPLDIKQQINDKICILECTSDKLFLTSRGRAYHFNIDENSELTFVRSFPLPASYKSENTFIPDSSKGELEVYKDDNMSISLVIEDKEKHQETDYGKLVIHSEKNILVKSHLSSSEKEELVVSEQYRDEVIPKKFQLVLSTN